MALKTYRAMILPGTEMWEMVDERKVLSRTAIPSNAFGFYFFDADEEAMEEDPRTAERSNVSGCTYAGVVHNVNDILWDISTAEMQQAVQGADTDKCVVCPYGDAAMILPFFEGKDSVASYA